MKPSVSYSLQPERVATNLLIILCVLLIVHIAAMQANYNEALGLKERLGFSYWHIMFFDLDEEESFGTWYNSGLLFWTALLLYHQSKRLSLRGDP